MKRYATTGWLRFLAAALPALLAWGTFAPSAARASCGDYVTVSNPNAPTPHGDRSPSHQPPTKPESVTPCSQHTPSDPTPPCRTPCQGPGCSGSPLPAPAPVSAAGQGSSQDHWDCLLTVPVLARSEASAPRPADGAARPFRHTLPVFHPPRTA
jgi:hypothetical protein